MSVVLSHIARVHERFVHRRRVSALAEAIRPLLPARSHVVDVGCGDGAVAALIGRQGVQLRVEGYDVLIREHTQIPVRTFDGQHLPLENSSVDFVLLIDVLHHTDDPRALMNEALRVARHGLVIKDHRLSRPGATTTLRALDWIGNRPAGVTLPYNYWSERQWRMTWSALGLRMDHYQTDLGLYPWPANWLFEKGIQFLARLSKAGI
jgi:SAM-dependent methyltransferase